MGRVKRLLQATKMKIMSRSGLKYKQNKTISAQINFDNPSPFKYLLPSKIFEIDRKISQISVYPGHEE